MGITICDPCFLNVMIRGENCKTYNYKKILILNQRVNKLHVRNLKYKNVKLSFIFLISAMKKVTFSGQ